MAWWLVPLLLIVLYLLLSVFPWLLMQGLHWLWRRASGRLPAQGRDLQAMRQIEQSQAAAWPTAAREGRYRDLDYQAQAALTALHAALKETQQLWAAQTGHKLRPVPITGVLTLQAWGPLSLAYSAWRSQRALDRCLTAVRAWAERLQTLEQRAQAIPAQLRGEWMAARAELDRLRALLEAEQEAGTRDLEEIGQRLSQIAAEIERTLEELAQSAPEEAPALALSLDQTLPGYVSALQEVEGQLATTTTARTAAQECLTRIHEALQDLDQRWVALTGRGATEPELARALDELRTGLTHLGGTFQQGTLPAYQQALSAGADLEAQAQRCPAQIDALDQAQQQSQQALEGSVPALAQAQALCEELSRQDPPLEPDQSLALIEQATESYREAEQQHALGTLAGYRASAALAEAAAQRLSAGSAGAGALPAQAQRVRDLLGLLSQQPVQAASDAPQEAGTAAWRVRAGRVREQLALYTRHWEKGLAGDQAEALANLDEVEAALERIPPNVRYQRRLRQSELGEALGELEHAQECLKHAQDQIVALETEQGRLAQRRREAEHAAQTLLTRTLPELKRAGETMLPELQQRLRALETLLVEGTVALRDPAQTDYDQVMQEWLPTVQRQVEDLRQSHDTSREHYQQALREALRRVDRQWARLNQLDLQAQPGPEEDLHQLVDDLNAWRSEAEHQADNPLALRDLAGRRALSLEGRLQAAYTQVVEGRRALDVNTRQHQRALQSARHRREVLQERQQHSSWPAILWDTSEADQAWQQVADLERAGRAARSLPQAARTLQQAVAAAQRAEELYAQLERQLSSAIRRLDEELRLVSSRLEQGARQAEALRRGVDGAVPQPDSTLEAQLDSARSAIELAQAATTFEDALRHLRDAQEAF